MDWVSGVRLALTVTSGSAGGFCDRSTRVGAMRIRVVIIFKGFVVFIFFNFKFVLVLQSVRVVCAFNSAKIGTHGVGDGLRVLGSRLWMSLK